MKKLIVLSMICLMGSGCALQSKPDPALQAAVNQHTAILGAISVYINDLQEKGILPKPQEPKK